MTQREDDASFIESLREALKQNWEHARHQEVQRQYQLYVFMLTLGVILTIVFQNHVAWHSTLMQFWPVFLFLMLFSLFISSNVAKWNLEFQNHIAEVQWISERLGLIRSISEERKREVGDSTLEDKEKETLLKDAMFQGYVGLPLPLRRRVHQNFLTLVDIILGGTSFAFLSGLLIAGESFLSSSFLGYESGLSWIHVRILEYVSGIVFGTCIVIWNQRIRKQMNASTTNLLDVREPKGISIRYKGKDPFYRKKRKKTEDKE